MSFPLTLFEPPMSMTQNGRGCRRDPASGIREWASRKREGKGERNSRYARRDFHFPRAFAIFLPRLFALRY
jgi:hypothetical protein